jgi:DNA-binding CsgD family transcriptional regulator
MNAGWRHGTATGVAVPETVAVAEGLPRVLHAYLTTGDLSVFTLMSDEPAVRALHARLAGRLDEAVSLANQAVSAGSFAALARAELAQTAALTGQVDVARRAVLDPVFAFSAQHCPTGDSGTWPWLDLARPWVAWAAGARGESLDIAATTVARLRLAGATEPELIALHDLVRLGQPATAADRLGALATDLGGSLAPALARHARAAAARDVDRLLAVADEFAAIGHHLYASGAATTAESVARRLRASGLAAVIDRARAFALPGLRLSGAPALSTRERHVAQLALTGLSSRRIGERLGLSARTVDNHLASVYRKLAISGRDELRTALDS